MANVVRREGWECGIGVQSLKKMGVLFASLEIRSFEIHSSEPSPPSSTRERQKTGPGIGKNRPNSKDLFEITTLSIVPRLLFGHSGQRCWWK